ncbi:hypothetical protein [Catenuloplanes atrovinosus]|uniref:PNPLA domain-containing protein n=1 Tax=Catenuloplanes atrovinosus TaxID=137266 RepID=A0AAE3YTA4_9ACTN|nr:hypothetical protein [Catenuloplanes atrovinosus]MDR7277491.1 hypothetical protein [Catenuloplanes atrovinosus]
MRTFRSSSWLPWLALIVAGAAGIAMREASGLLARLQLAGAPAYGAGALNGWPGLPWEHREITEAITAWSARTAGTDLHGPALGWLYWYAALDALLFVPAYAVLLFAALRAVGYGRRPARWLVAPVAVADQGETLWTLVAVGGLDGPPDGAAATLLALFSLAKWTATALAAGAVLLRWLPADVGPPPPGRGDRVWRRHRIQLAAVATLFLALVAPLGGPLDQGPDIVRAWTDQGFSPVRVIGPLAGTLLLCVALWVAGRWALLDGTAPERRPGRSWFSLIAGAVLAAVFLILRFVAGLDMGLNLLAVALILIAVGGTSWLITRFFPSTWLLSVKDTVTDHPGDRWERVRYLGRCLSVAPLVALGLLLVRAFSGPVLLAHTGGIPAGTAWAWLLTGALLAVAGAPLAAWGIARLERGWIDATGVRRRVVVPDVAGIAVAVLGAAVAAGGMADPRATGEGLRVIGLVTTVLATLVIVFGRAQRAAEVRLPTPVFSRVNRTPVLTFSLVTLLLAAQFDAGRYHNVSVAGNGGAPPPAVAGSALDAAFRGWLDAAGGCAPAPVADGRPAVPLVLVAAPGGGARAAFWTAAALDNLTDEGLQGRGRGATACGDRAIFAISGVSGGSLGAAVWASSRGQDGAAGVPVSETPLAALLAAGFYRDLPHLLHGIDGAGPTRIADRARVLEYAWEQDNPALAADMMTVAPAGTGWRPLLLFNGTAVETGCRVVVAPIPAAVSGGQRGDELPSCRAAAGPPGGTDSGRFAIGALDARDYLADQPGGGDCIVPDGATLRLSTAALLSARFPYVTPTGGLVSCAAGGDVSKTFDVDGGYLENNGIALALDLWRGLEPLVAAHNRAAGPGAPVVVPMLVVLDSHYQRRGVPPASDQPTELLAPLTAYRAPHEAHDEPIMLQDALLELSGPPPGLNSGTLRVGDDPCGGSRVFRVAPDEQPGVEAPLGWVLSDAARRDLSAELDRQTASGARCATIPERAAGTLVPALEPGGMATVLQLLGGALTVR